MSFLGVDLGTSFIKAAVLNLEKRRLERVSRTPFPEPVATGDPLRCECDPREIVCAVRKLMNDRLEAVSNCVTWRDQRVLAQHPSGAGSYFDVILSRTNTEERRQLGNELEPPRPICFLFWFREQGKLSPGLIPASIPDFVLSALCASKPGVDATNASSYGAFNLATSDWHH